MEEKTMEDLKNEATALGLEFKGNISRAKLEDLIESAYLKEESKASPSPVTAVEPKKKPLEGVVLDETPEMKHRRVIAELRRKALETRVVRVILNDKRENSDMTSYFVANGPIGKFIPLDTPIELEQCLIDQLLRTKTLNHVKGADGNNIAKMNKKFVIEYIK